MIKEILQDAVRKCEIERDRQANVARETAIREKIAPYNAEIDRLRDEAINSKQEQLNANIQAYQEKFAEERKNIIEAAEKKKADNADAVILAETSVVTAEYNKHIAKLNQQIAEVKE